MIKMLKKTVFKRRSVISQRERKEIGTEIEHIIFDDIDNHIEIKLKGEVSSRDGIDIFLYDGGVLNIEVKSANAFHVEGNRVRRGRFIIKPDDLKDSNFFAFVEKPVDTSYVWDRSKPLKIRYAKTENVARFIINRIVMNKINKINKQLKQGKITQTEYNNKLNKIKKYNVYSIKSKNIKILIDDAFNSKKIRGMDLRSYLKHHYT